MDGQTATTDSSTSTEDDRFADEDSAQTDSIQAIPEVATETDDDSRGTIYPLIEIGGATIALYFIIWLLSKLKVLKTSTHRKIWNVILLLAFMVSGLLGLMLVVQLNYDVMGDWYSTFMWLHVDFGIVMYIISIFHALWHTKYYMTLFKKKKA